MKKKHLHKAGIEGDLLGIEPEDDQHFGHGGQHGHGHGQHQVNDSQHGEEIKHGLVERWLCLHHVQEGAVPKEGYAEHSAEWDGIPGVHIFQPRDASQEKHE